MTKVEAMVVVSAAGEAAAAVRGNWVSVPAGGHCS